MDKSISLIESFRRTINLLNKKEQKRFYSVGLISIFSSFLDIGGLMLVFPAINAAMHKDKIFETPVIGQLLTDVGVEDVNIALLLFFLIVLVVIVLRNIVSVSLIYIQANFSSRIASQLVVSGFAHYIKLGIIDLRKFNLGSLMRNTVVNPVQFSRFVINSQLIILTESTIVIIMMSMILWYDPIVFLAVALILAPVTLLFYRTMKNRIASYGVAQDRILKRAQHVTLEGLDGYVDLFVYNKTQSYINELYRLTQSLIPVETRMIVIPQLAGKMIEVIAFTGVVIILIYSVFFADNSDYFLDLMTVFALMIYRLMPTYNRILHSAMQIKNYNHLFDIVISDAEIEKGNRTIDDEIKLDFKHSIEFDRIGYQYPNTETRVLQDIDIQIRKGEIIGFIGESGSGKTTLVSILMRLLIEETGSIRVDGVLLNESNVKQWLNCIGYVQQDVFIQEMSVARNVAFGEDEDKIDWSRVQKALEEANLWSFVCTLKEGVNSVIQERGKNLSGGQKQRLAIARALYRNADLIVFDEATSALDNQSEEEINNSIKQLAELGKTVVIIAHRYTSLRNCGRIVELKNGEINRTVSYTDLASGL